MWLLTKRFWNANMSKTLQATFPSVIRDQLRAVRTRQMVFASVRALAIALTVLVTLMLTAMLIDWAVTLFDTRIRVAMTVTTLLASVVTLVLGAWGPIRQALGWTTAARQVDQRVPQMEERWRTVASLAEAGRETKDITSRAMLARVTQEAVAMSSLVQPQRVVSGEPLRRPLLGLGLALLALGLLFLSHWGQTTILWARFWSPTANISATHLQVLTGDALVPRGETREIAAKMTGLQRDSVQLVLRRESTPEEELLVVSPADGTARFSVDVDETVSYRVQAGDGRSEWHTLTAIDFPELKEVHLTVTPPSYVDEPPSEKTLIPSRLRAVQGSRMELAIKPQIELQSLTLKVVIPVAESISEATKEGAEPPAEQVKILTLARGDDGWYRLETGLVESFSFTPQLVSTHGLANKTPRVCRVEVVEDHAPVARIVSPGGEGSAGLDDVLDIRFEAHDDHGIATAELVIYEEQPESSEPPKVLAVKQIPLGDQALQKHVMGKIELNLKELGLKEGTSISYSVRVTDNRDLEMDTRSQLDQMLAAVGPQNPMDEPDPSGPMSEETGPNSTTDSDASDSGETSRSHKLDQGADSASKDGPTGDEKSGQPPMGEQSPAEKGDDAGPEAMLAANGEQTPKGTPRGDAKPATPSSDIAKTAPSRTANPAAEDLASARTQSRGPKGSDGKDSDTGEKHPAETMLASTDTGKKTGDSPERPLKPGAKTPTGEPAEPSEAGDSPTADQGADSKNGEPSEPSRAEGDSETPPIGDPASKRPMGDAQTANNTGKPMPPGSQSPSANGQPAPGDSKSDEGQPREGQPDSPPRPQLPGTPAAAPMPNDPRPDGEVTLAGESDPRRPSGPAVSQEPQPAGDPQNSGGSSPQLAMAQGASSGKTPPPKVKVRLNPQQADAGQQQETDRRRLQITATLEAVAASNDPSREKTKPVREKVVLIEQMLQAIEGKLTALYQHEVDSSLRREKFQELDVRLKEVEEFVRTLDESTRETVFEFVGLQMVDICSSHVTPAHDAVFLAVRTPDSGADLPTEEALHHVISARELLQALLKRYDRVAQDQELAEKLDETVKMYNVYVERSQRLLREAQQNLDPLKLQRAMEVVEVDQAYLDRLAEVTRMRRDMMTELARILADDPRLRSRYLDLIKRRRSSLSNQLAELAARQDQTAQEVLGWLSVDENQRASYWQQISDLRLDVPNALAKEAQQLADRIEKQLPLALDPEVGAAAGAVATARQLALAARRCDLAVGEMRKSSDATMVAAELQASAESLVFEVGELAAVLDRIGFESESQDGVSEYVQRRQIEVRAFADQADQWAVTARAVAGQAFPELAAMDQHQIAIATELLRAEILDIETDLAPEFTDEVQMPQEVINLTQDLQRVMEAITFHQTSATFALEESRLDGAAAQHELALKGFDEAQKILNKLRRQTAEALDQIKPMDPNIAELQDPTLDQFLAELEREPDIEAQLGIPDRPRNIRILQDAMAWQQNGSRLLGASSEGAMARAQQMKDQKSPPDDSDDRDRKPIGDQEAEKPTDPSQMTEEEKQQLADSRETQAMLKERMERARAELEKQAQDPTKTDKQRKQLAEMAKQMGQSLKQMEPGLTPQQLWRQIVQADQAKAALEALAQGKQIPDEQWNKLMSTLGDGQGQVSGRVPSEDYRRSIEQYQERLRQLTGER